MNVNRPRMNMETIKRNTKETLEKLYVSEIEAIRDTITEKSQMGFDNLTFNFTETKLPGELENELLTN